MPEASHACSGRQGRAMERSFTAQPRSEERIRSNTGAPSYSISPSILRRSAPEDAPPDQRTRAGIASTNRQDPFDHVAGAPSAEQETVIGPERISSPPRLMRAGRPSPRARSHDPMWKPSGSRGRERAAYRARTRCRSSRCRFRASGGGRAARDRGRHALPRYRPDIEGHRDIRHGGVLRPTVTTPRYSPGTASDGRSIPHQNARTCPFGTGKGPEGFSMKRLLMREVAVRHWNRSAGMAAFPETARKPPHTTATSPSPSRAAQTPI